MADGGLLEGNALSSSHEEVGKGRDGGDKSHEDVVHSVGLYCQYT
jgi:hypothetical protein